MILLKGKDYTFLVNFGVSKTSKTVQYQIINDDLSEREAYTATGVVELGNGEYGVKRSFNAEFTGYIRWKETESQRVISDPITIIEDYITKIGTIFSVETGRWKIENNQMKFYNSADQVILTFNLKDAQGNPTMDSPVERMPV